MVRVLLRETTKALIAEDSRDFSEWSSVYRRIFCEDTRRTFEYYIVWVRVSVLTSRRSW